MHTRWLSLFVLVTIVLALAGTSRPVVAAPAVTTPTPEALPVPVPCTPEDQEAPLSSGALALYCQPENWNGSVVFWAHGYVPFIAPLDFYNLELPDGTYLPDLVQSLGFAFATTSYSVNGLAVLQGVADLNELADRHQPAAGGRAYLVGASEGGLISALLAEQPNQRFDGVLAACGLVGDFRRQVNYWGDFRVLYDYFFPNLLPASPIAIPDNLIAGWDTGADDDYESRVAAAATASPNQLRQLLATSKAPYDPAVPATAISTTLNLLWYNVFATNDATGKLDGNPYDNRGRWYYGSDNDLALNLGRNRVQRFRADPAALHTIAAGGYETTGRPNVPIVLPHTTGDEIVPFEQTIRYWLKARPQGNGSVWPIPINRYGHCNFTSSELLLSFGLVVLLASGQELQGLAELTEGELDLAATRAEFERQLKAFEAAEAADAGRPRTAAGTVVYLPIVLR